MAVTIVHARDRRESANFFAEVFGLAKPTPFGRFLDVDVANEVTLAFLETHEEIQIQHYAFLVSETEFDQIFGPGDGTRARLLGRSRAPAQGRD